jgi:hypothetical protein
MILLNRWKFFSKTGNELNLEKIPKIVVEIKNSVGYGAWLQPITDPQGNLLALDIIEPGLNFNTGGLTNLEIIDENGSFFSIPFSSITFDVNGGFSYIDVSAAPAAQFSYPSFTLEGNLFFDKVSTGLIENEHIFIIEESRKSDGSKNYIYPRYDASGASLLWKWTDEKTLQQDKDAFFIFDVDTVSSTTPFIEKVAEKSFELENGPSANFDISSGKYIRTFNPLDNNSIQLNIATSYPTEGIFERKLELYDNNTIQPVLLAEIYLRSEIEPEDERFLTILDNLGQKINYEEEFIFRDSDINEELIDYELLNRKRKEFILEHSNIIPYIGSYKALFNALNWLGYDDLRIKEYWLNIDENSNNYKKYKPIDVPFALKQKGRDVRSEELLPSKIYKKTSLFGLYYDINRESGDVDEFGIPIVEDSFMFTNEEVLIKLYALKNYLKRKFLPLNARIIDIIGEGVYFERYRINSWQDGTKIFKIEPTREAKFSCTPHVSTIIDLRELENYDYFKPAKILAFLNNNNNVGLLVEDGGFGYITSTGGTGVLPIELIGGIPQINDPLIDVIPQFNANILNGVVVSITPVVFPGCSFSSSPIATVVPESTNPDQTFTILSYIGNRILGSFIGSQSINNLPDQSNLPVGAPVLLETSSFDVTWDELTYPWDDFYYDFQPAELEAIISGGILTSINVISGGNGYTAPPVLSLTGGSPTVSAVLGIPVISGGSIVSIPIISGGSNYIGVPTILQSGGFPISQLNSWETIGIGEFYELEWRITGPNQFSHIHRGRADELQQYALTVPYTGNYNVELVLFDTDNNFVNEYKKDCFSVNLPEVNFSAHGRFTNCKDTWDELNFSWNEANFMWIHPVKHSTKWNDMNTTWDSFEFSTYVDQYDNQFPAVTYENISKINETDRFLGNLIDIDKTNKIIKIDEPSFLPPINVNDWIYFKREENIFPVQVLNAIYEYSLDSINLINNTSIYSIDFNFLTNTSTINRPNVYITPPISGVQATAVAVINGSVYLPAFYLQNAGADLINAIDLNGNIVPAVPVATLPGQIVYNFVCTQPENGGIPASGQVIIDTINNSVFQLIFSNIGSGYNNVPDVIIYDANNYIVKSSTLQDPAFWLRIDGPINEIELINPGSGYSFIPTITIDPPVLPGSPSTANALIDLNSIYGFYTVSSLPLGINTNWDVLREPGQTLMVNSDIIYNPTNNINGLKINDWITLENINEVPKIQKIPIVNDLYNVYGQNSGIIVGPGDYTSQFKIGEKCKMYEERSSFYGSSLSNPGEWDYDLLNNTITIVDPLNAVVPFNPSIELIPGYHILTIINRDNNFSPPLVTYTQRFLVEHIQESMGDFILKILPIDGDINQINTYNLPSQTELIYKFNEFTVVISDTIYNGTNTEVTLNYNDWPINANSISLFGRYLDYGILNGSYSLEVKQVGIIGNNTLITVDDPNSELWRTSVSFNLGWRVFDEDYTKKRYGSDIFDWNNLDEITWNDSCTFTWDMMEYHAYMYSGFKILNVQPGGRIQWNEEIVFEFDAILGSMTFIQKLNQAVIELNQTDNPGLSRFNYVLMPDNINPTYIMAVSKNPGGENIGYLRFLNGVEGEWVDPTLSHSFPLGNTDNPLWLNGFYGPENKPANWNPLIRAYNEWGLDPAGDIGWYPTDRLPYIYDSTERREESLRIPYLRSASSAFTWEETFVSTKNIEVPIYTMVYFRADGCKIAGKTEYLWRITDNVGNVLIECIKPYLIWTFTQEGEYSIYLKITDTNNNIKETERKGFVNVIKIPELNI